jgi:RND family efflux transporter MFP subunit
MSTKKTALPILAIVILLFALSGCRDRIKPGNKEVKRQEVQGVTLAKIRVSRIDALYETSGTIRAHQVSAVASRTMGTVTAIHVKEGDTVKAGDLLLTIDDRDAAQRVKAAEAGYREALKALESAEQQASLTDITSKRYKKLHDEKVITPQEFDQIETTRNVARLDRERAGEAVSRAKALLEEARVHQGFTRIRAPFSGVVSARKIDKGNMTVPGGPLFIVEDTSRFKIEASVDERLSGRLKQGTTIKIRMDASGEDVKGIITKVVPAIDPATRSFTIEAEVGGRSLKSGLYGKVFIPDGSREAILVPGPAVVEKGQLTGVYTVDEKGVISYRLIRTGKPYGSQIEVMSGLRAGDTIIVEGVQKAIDGGVVRQ